MPHNYGENISLLAALGVKGVSAPMTVEGAVDTAVFRAYIEQVLGPTLRPGDIVVLDNLAVHKAAGITEAIVARVSNRKSHSTILLREPWREGTRVKNRTLANLTHWPTEQIEALNQVLKGHTNFSPPLAKVFTISRSRPHRHTNIEILVPDGVPAVAPGQARFPGCRRHRQSKGRLYSPIFLPAGRLASKPTSFRPSGPY